MTPAQRKWIQTIHVAKRETALDDDAYYGLLYGAAGITHASEITTWEQYTAVIKAFKKLGFVVKAGRKHPLKKPIPDEERDPDIITAKQEYYIKGLWNLASRAKDEASLRKMTKRITGVDDITFCPKNKATDLILALRAITSKEGFNPDRK